MTELLTELQLHLMVALSGACGTIAVFVLIAKNIPLSRRIALMLLETSCMLLLFFDRLAYSYAGNTDHAGYVMVRFTNFMVYELTLVVVLALNLYLIDLMKNEVKIKELPKTLTAVNIIICTGIVMVVVSQFNGLYYYFDAENRYHRGPGFLICYIFPVLAPALQLYVVIKHRKKFSRRILLSLLLFITVPVIAAFIQIFAYGFSIINISIVGVAIFVYVSALYDIDKKIERANNLEIQFLQEERKSMHRLFDQTASAFVNALDERDGYVKGHSARVAEYAEMIARACGKNEKECDEIYFAGLLHDVGRIGVPE
ncbi:MAG: HDOD domain-containing protein, partial [Oscillospiraceae bacterium]|nr:HDOD domain-containing protein [Oscillospiraceae bacterium]